MIKLMIPVEPVPMGRPRVVHVHGRTMTFNPHRMVNFERSAKLYGIKYMRNHHLQPIKGKPLSVTLLIYRRMRKSTPKYKRSDISGKFIHTFPIKKPDIDNYGKSIIDSQNGVIWYDDRQIVHEDMYELYSDKPRVIIYCTTIKTIGFTNLHDEFKPKILIEK